MNQATSRLPVQGGFTLVELLVALTLMSIIMLAMAGSLRGMGQTEERVQQRLARMDEFRVSSGFIRTTLGRISARRSEALQTNGKPAVQFVGLAQSITWLGVMPAREGAGGRYFFRLAVEPASAAAESRPKQALIVRFLPFVGHSGAPDWGQADWRVLVEDVQAFTVEYEDRMATPLGWKPQWDITERLPDAVRIALSTGAETWPPLTIPLRPMSQGASAGSGVATFGGGAAQ